MLFKLRKKPTNLSGDQAPHKSQTQTRSSAAAGTAQIAAGADGYQGAKFPSNGSQPAEPKYRRINVPSKEAMTKAGNPLAKDLTNHQEDPARAENAKAERRQRQRLENLEGGKAQARLKGLRTLPLGKM